MLRITTWNVLLLMVTCFCSCQQDMDIVESTEVSCHRSILEGEWTVEVEATNYYEEHDSMVMTMGTYTAFFDMDGTAIIEGSVVSNYLWSLQCTPNHLFMNRVKEQFEQVPQEEILDYTTFSNILQVTKITADEIHMHAEFFIKHDDVERKVIQDLIFYQVQ